MPNKNNGQKNKRRINRKNMNNEKVKTKIETKTKTRLITGVVLAVIAAIGIGTVIWYFAIAPNVDQTTAFLDTYTTLDSVESGDDIALNAGVIDFYDNEKVFQNDLVKVGYVCPDEIKNRVAKIQIHANRQLQIDSENALTRDELNSFPNTLEKLVGISVLDENNNILDETLISEHITSTSVSTWYDLARWKSDPKILITFSNGSILPVSKGETKIRAAICGVLSNELDAVVDPDKNANVAFSNIAAARMGDQFPFYSELLTNGVLLSKEIQVGPADKYVKKITATIKPKIITWQNPNLPYINISKRIPGKIRLFAILNNGNNWVEIPDKNNIDNPIQIVDDNGEITFENLSLPQYQDQGNIRYALFYQYDSSAGQSPNFELRPFTAFGLPTTDPIILPGDQFRNFLISKVPSEFIGHQRNFMVGFNATGYSFITETEEDVLDFAEANIYQDETFYNANLLYLDTDRTASVAPGLAYFSGTRITLVDRDPNNERREIISQGIVLTMPAKLSIDEISLETTVGPMSCPEGEVRVDDECVPPLPPDGGEEGDCGDDFKCPRGQTRLECTQNCKGLNVNLKAAPESCDQAPCEIKFNAEVSGGSGSYLYGWRFGDKPMDVLPDSMEQKPSHTYNETSQYLVNLYVQDSKNTSLWTHSTKIINVGEMVCGENEVFIDGVCQKTKVIDSDLMKNATQFYRGADRIIFSWKVGKDEYKNKDLNFRYGTVDPKNLKENKNGEVLFEDEKTIKAHYNKEKDYYYVVLKDLKGGEFSDKNDDGFINGRKPYGFQVSLGDKVADVSQFKTLNRFQTILYYYNLVFSDTFDLEKYEQPDKSLRAGGADFFYRPPAGQEPLSLKGVHFTLLNDRKYEEFNKRIQATAQKYGNKKAMEQLYRRVHDRIYDDDLEKYFDTAGVDYWTKQVERKDDDKIDILGAKFAISVSPEFVGDISAMPAAEQKRAQADEAYVVVLKRGGDQEGLAILEKLPNPKAMREKLAQSGEYNDRLKEIEKTNGRKAAIEELYETLYARAADVEGVNYWDNTGMSIQEIKKEFLNSSDFANVAQ